MNHCKIIKYEWKTQCSVVLHFSGYKYKVNIYLPCFLNSSAKSQGFITYFVHERVVEYKKHFIEYEPKEVRLYIKVWFYTKKFKEFLLSLPERYKIVLRNMSEAQEGTRRPADFKRVGSFLRW